MLYNSAWKVSHYWHSSENIVDGEQQEANCIFTGLWSQIANCTTGNWACNASCSPFCVRINFRFKWNTWYYQFQIIRLENNHELKANFVTDKIFKLSSYYQDCALALIALLCTITIFNLILQHGGCTKIFCNNWDVAWVPLMLYITTEPHKIYKLLRNIFLFNRNTQLWKTVILYKLSQNRCLQLKKEGLW